MEKKKTAPEYLAEAAIEIISRKDLERVSVKEICEYCGVSRRSFYNYFEDINDLVQWIYFQKLEEFYREHREEITFRMLMTETGRILWKYESFFENIIKYTGQNNFKDTSFKPLFAYYQRIMEERFQQPMTPKLKEELTLYMLGMIEYVYRAFSEGHAQPLGEAVQLFVDTIPRDFDPYL